MKKKLSAEAMAAEYRREWGVPDWRHASSYPVANTMGDNAWRWEFLRRHQDYRADWERTQKNAAKDRHTKYGLAMMVDPRSSEGFIRFERLQVFGKGSTVDTVLAIGLNPWVSDEIHFNALKCQLANMRRCLKWGKASHSARKTWAFYLRALDAEGAENPNYPHLGKVLYPNTKRARQDGEETLKSAHEIQDLFVRPIL
jgi:hypothetical protein